MDMVNDGKDPILDTPQAVKEALLSGKDLYNTETGDLIVSYLTDYEDPTVEVFSYTPDELLDEIARQGGDLENLELTAHDIILRFHRRGRFRGARAHLRGAVQPLWIHLR